MSGDGRERVGCVSYVSHLVLMRRFGMLDTISHWKSLCDGERANFFRDFGNKSPDFSSVIFNLFEKSLELNRDELDGAESRD